MDVKENQKQKKLVVVMHMVLVTNSMYTVVCPETFFFSPTEPPRIFFSN